MLVLILFLVAKVNGITNLVSEENAIYVKQQTLQTNNFVYRNVFYFWCFLVMQSYEN